MKIPGAHLQIVGNECTNFLKNPCTHLLEHLWTKSSPQMRTDRQIDGKVETNIPPPPKFQLQGV